jgi:putative FmdB family regulatory protein
MPIYEYTCTTCEHQFERLRPMNRMDDEAPCPECEGESERQLSVFMSFSTTESGGVSPIAGGGGCGGCGPGGCACASGF